MTQPEGRSQFTLRQLLWTVLGVGIALGLMSSEGIHGWRLVLVAFCALIPVSIWAYLQLSHGGRRRARVWITIAATIIGVSPFLGAGGYTFIAPGMAVPLPRLEFTWLAWLLTPFYLVGELVLFLLDWILRIALGPFYVRLIVFADEGPVAVRPFAVCVFWLGIAAIFGVSLLIGQWRGAARRRDRSLASEPPFR